ncbi:DUF6456 domain-containing protein [uncultured Cohaesibacter sp.]|uniref:DUF6456 domain-containing protein n=1 Tax=uncultured Cohaesibacter sp. TaxID=1002546 RepID=UPI0029C88C9A|nr:DUF6456 domain-containing protein [uncultured Cohaesibacter sp.]
MKNENGNPSNPDEQGPDIDETLLAVARSAGKSMDRWPASHIRELIQRGWLRKEGERLILTSSGKSRLRRARLEEEAIRISSGDHALRATHIARTSKAKHKYVAPQGEASPLQQLAKRKNSDGKPYLGASEVEAGERLCRDFERGQLVRALGINWQRLGQREGAISKNARGSKAREGHGDAALDAQDRFRAAIKYVGEEFADPLIDFCCFLKGLEELERTRSWPARSAKLVMSLALKRLARYYGLSNVANGPEKNPMRHWGTEDYRPDFSSS